MVSIIKNQILKHLSKFTKNLSADQLNLSTFKGEGELTNLELHEEVLMDLLELPNWLRLTKATCNKVSIKVQWTNLKSIPIFINLDEVLVQIETCEELRPLSSYNIRSSSASKYGFPDMVIDGITVAINNVEIQFKSRAFHASFQFSRVRLESRSPSWHRSNLRMTRLKDPDSGQLLIFKELEWQMLRIEAAATDNVSEFTSPLRLITNQARCRITIKKSLSDCGILASRLFFIVDDLLWILTDTQIKAALHFADSLSGLIQKSSEINKRVKAAHKIEFLSRASQMSQHLPSNTSQAQNVLPRAFSLYDMVETSFHIYSSRIDLHFCDEASPGDGRSNHVLLSDGGAMQVTLTGMAFDYYPYHLAIGGRKHWMRYGDVDTSCLVWVEQLMAAYKQQLLNIVCGEVPKNPLIRQHLIADAKPSSHEERRRSSGQNKAAMISTFLKRLMASCFILRVDDFCVHQVSTTATKKKVPEKFLASDKTRLMLPSNLPAIHLEFIDYYFPGDENIPVPLANLHLHLNPIQLKVDPVTFLWLNAFSSGLQKSQKSNQSFVENSRPLDIRIEALMPRIIVQEDKVYTNQPSRPNSIQVHISRLVATNSRIGDNCDRANLQQCLKSFEEGSLFSSNQFPHKEGDLFPLSHSFSLHAMGKDDSISTTSLKSATILNESLPGSINHDHPSDTSLRRDMLWTENTSTWCIHLEPIWVDFCESDSCKSRPAPFIDAVQATMWVAQDLRGLQMQLPEVDHQVGNNSSSVSDLAYNPSFPTTPLTCETPNAVHILAQFKSLVSVQLTHYQYVFLLRCTEIVTELVTNLALDSEVELQIPLNSTSKLCFAVILPEVDLSFLIPVNMPKCSSNVDSMRDDLSSSTANTGAMDRVGSTGNLVSQEPSVRPQMRESHSDNQIVNQDCQRILEPLTTSCSDYTISSVRFQKSSDSKSEVCGVTVIPLDTQNAGRTVTSISETRQTSLSGSSAVKKSFSNFVASIDSTLLNHNKMPTLLTSPSSYSDSKTSTMINSRMFDDVETISLSSDLSDSDNFTILNSDGMFSDESIFNMQSVDPASVEVASEVKEDSSSDKSNSLSLRRQDLVKIVVFKMGRVEMVHESQGINAMSKVQVHYLQSEDSGTMAWEEFQAKFSSSSRTWKEGALKYTLPTCAIKLRFQRGPLMQFVSPEAVDRGFLEARISDINLNLLLSSIASLKDLLEDEIPPVAIPMNMAISKFHLHLQEDCHSSDVTTAEPIPTVVDVQELIVSRTPDGVFHIIPGDMVNCESPVFETKEQAVQVKSARSGSRHHSLESVTEARIWARRSSLEDLEEKVFHLEEENEQLRLKLIAMETEKQKYVNHKEEDRSVQESLLTQLQEEVCSLREEKESLLATLQLLQNELLIPEKKSSTKVHNFSAAH